MSNSDEPSVYYVDNGPSASNYYNPVTEAIILDERLKEYPLAHSYVRSHEFGHYHRRGSFLENLWYEFKHDAEIAFSEKPAIEQMREYYEAKETGWEEQKRMLAGFMHNVIRSLWVLIVYPSGRGYRYVNRRRSGSKMNTGGVDGSY